MIVIEGYLLVVRESLRVVSDKTCYSIRNIVWTAEKTSLAVLRYPLREGEVALNAKLQTLNCRSTSTSLWIISVVAYSLDHMIRLARQLGDESRNRYNMSLHMMVIGDSVFDVLCVNLNRRQHYVL